MAGEPPTQRKPIPRLPAALVATWLVAGLWLCLAYPVWSPLVAIVLTPTLASLVLAVRAWRRERVAAREEQTQH